MASSDINIIRPQGPPKYMDLVRPGISNSLKPKLPEKSKTLMRSVVNKPSLEYSHKLASQSPLPAVKNDLVSKTVEPKTYVHAVDSDREARAQNSNRSELVSRFGSQSGSSQSYGQGSYTDQPASLKPQPATQPNVATSTQPSMNIFEKSFEPANAHNKQPFTSKLKESSRLGRHLGIVAASLLTVLLVGSVLVYQNFNKISLYVASSKVGFSAKVPSYNPTSYGLASVSTGSGVIETVYQSSADSSRAYTISEKGSNWDSNTLLQSYVINTADQNYQTVHADGRTIYLYGPHNATWVNGGIWYIITGNDSLSNQQLVQLATST